MTRIALTLADIAAVADTPNAPEPDAVLATVEMSARHAIGHRLSTIMQLRRSSAENVLPLARS